MDAVSLRNELDSATYHQVRFDALSAVHLKPNAGKGRLLINVDIGLQSAEGPDIKAGEHRFISTIQLKLYGVPRDILNDEDAILAAAFKIEVDIRAIVIWEQEPSEELKNSTECAAHIARPLFMLCATEARALASKLGFSGLMFDIDLQRVLTYQSTDLSEVPDLAKKRTAAKKVTKKSTRRSGV